MFYDWKWSVMVRLTGRRKQSGSDWPYGARAHELSTRAHYSCRERARAWAYARAAHLAVSVPVRRAECLRAILGAVCAPATGQRAATPAPCADSRRVADLVTPIQFLNSIKLVTVTGGGDDYHGMVRAHPSPYSLAQGPTVGLYPWLPMFVRRDSCFTEPSRRTRGHLPSRADAHAGTLHCGFNRALSLIQREHVL